MAVTSIDIDQNALKQAKLLAGTTSNRETVDLALRTLIAIRQQPQAIERILSHEFEDEQIVATTIEPDAATLAAAALHASRSKPERAVADRGDGVQP